MSTDAIKAAEAKIQASNPVSEVNAAPDPVVESDNAVVEDSAADDAAAVGETQEVTGDSANPDGTDAPARSNKGVGKRINELVREKHEERRAREVAETRMREYEAELAKYRQPPAQTAPASTTEGRPTLEQCDFDQELYTEKLTEWKLDQREAKQRQDKQAEAQQQRLQTYQQRADQFADEHPDYSEKVESLPMTAFMRDAIFETEVEPQIAYYLANNPSELEAIRQKTPAGQIIAIGRLAAQLSAPPRPDSATQPPPSAPSPPPPPPRLAARSPATPPVTQWDMNRHIEAIRAKNRR